MTWIEAMVGVAPAEQAEVESFLATFERIGLDDAIAQRSVELRRTHRIKLADAIIWATAQTRGLTLVTRNTKDFALGTPGIRVPYAV